MTTDSLPTLIRRVLARAGQFTGFLWVRPMKTRKGVSSVVTKTVRCVGRVGLDYSNRVAVQEARESGELPSTPQPLPWGAWLLFPYLITHKDALYVRIYPVKGRVPKVIYKIDGQIATKAQAQALCLASEFGEVREDIGCMTLRAEALRVVR
jgi:hypothetical protein